MEANTNAIARWLGTTKFSIGNRLQGRCERCDVGGMSAMPVGQKVEYSFGPFRYWELAPVLAENAEDLPALLFRQPPPSRSGSGS
jgi:hypothetical protein